MTTETPIFHEYTLLPNGEISGHTVHRVDDRTREGAALFRKVLDSSYSREPTAISGLYPQYSLLRMMRVPTKNRSMMFSVFWNGQMVSVCTLLRQYDELAFDAMTSVVSSFSKPAGGAMHFADWPVMLSLRTPNPLTYYADATEISQLQAWLAAAYFLDEIDAQASDL
jgi:hypothetical protein